MRRAPAQPDSFRWFAVASFFAVSLAGAASPPVPPVGQPVPRGAEVQGRISAPDGQPLGGATVRLLAEPAGAGSPRSVQPDEPRAEDPAAAPSQSTPARPSVTRTADDGSFRIGGLVGESFAIRVESPAGAPFTVRAIPPGAQVTIRLRPGHAVVGSVIDRASQEPIAGADVRACDAETERFGDDACIRARTDSRGRFRFDHLAAGQVAIDAVAEARARAAAVRLELPLAEDAPPLAFRLGPGGRIAGRVVDDRGAPLADVTVSLVRQDGRLTALRRAGDPAPSRVSGVDGRFAFDGVPAGEGFRVSAMTEDRPRRMSEPVRVEAGSNVLDVTLRLSEAARMVVRLVDPDERPFSGELAAWLRRADAAEGPTSGGQVAAIPQERIEDRGEGRFVIDGLESGVHDVVLRPRGWAAVDRSAVFLVPGKSADLGTVVLERGRVLRGRVTDPSGAPIAKAEIQAISTSAEGPDRATSDETGAYELGGLDEGPILLLRVSAAGHASVVRESIPADETTVDFTLEPAGRIEGLVVLERGGSPESFTVAAEREAAEPASSRDFRFSPSHQQTFTDPEGRFRLEGLGAGTYTVVAQSPGFAPARRSGVSVPAGEVAALGKLVLERGTVLSGRVIDAEGLAVAGARIEVTSGGGSGFVALAPVGPAATSDGEGSFTVEGLGPGMFTVLAAHPDHATAELRVEVQDGEAPQPIVLRLPAGGILAGSVRDAEGQPLAGARVLAFAGYSKIGDAGMATTDAYGQYEMTHLAPGSYQVTAMPPGSSNPFGLGAKSASIREGETTLVDFGEEARISVSGTVRRGDQPLADVELFFLPANSFEIETVRNVRADAMGRYVVQVDRPGRFKVVVQEPGRLPLSGAAPVELDVPDQPDVVLDVVLREGGLGGTVKDADGRPIEGAHVIVRPSGSIDSDAWDAGCATDALGAWSIDGLDQESYDVSASAPGFRPTRRTAVPFGSQVDLWLERGSSVRGRLVDPAGGGIAGAWVTATPAGQPADLPAAEAETDVNGAFVLTAPVEGALELTALARGWAPARATVLPDSAEELELRASLGGALSVTARGADGRPLAGVRLVVRPEPKFAGWELARMLEPVPQTDAAGTSRVERLSPGTWVVSVAGRDDIEPVHAAVVEGVERPVALHVP